MKLTKGKISKLYNKKHQSRRRNKKMPKNNRSFRKKRPLNLASKSLKMRGGLGGPSDQFIMKSVNDFLSPAISYFAEKSSKAGSYLYDKAKVNVYEAKSSGFKLFYMSEKSAFDQIVKNIGGRSDFIPKAVELDADLYSLYNLRNFYYKTVPLKITAVFKFYNEYKQKVNAKMANYTYEDNKALNTILEDEAVEKSVYYPIFENDINYITEQFYKKVFGPSVDIQRLASLSDGQKDELFAKVIPNDVIKNYSELYKIEFELEGQISKPEYDEEMKKIEHAKKPDDKVVTFDDLPDFFKGLNVIESTEESGAEEEVPNGEVPKEEVPNGEVPKEEVPNRNCPSENKQPMKPNSNKDCRKQQLIFHPDKNFGCTDQNLVTSNMQQLNDWCEEFKEQNDEPTEPNSNLLAIKDEKVGGKSGEGAMKLSYDEYFKYVNDYAGKLKSYEEINEAKNKIHNEFLKESISMSMHDRFKFDLKNLENAFYRIKLGKLTSKQRDYINELDYETKEFFFFYVINWIENDKIRERTEFLDNLNANENAAITDVLNKMTSKKNSVGENAPVLGSTIDKIIELGNQALKVNMQPNANETPSDATASDATASDAKQSESTFEKSGAKNADLVENQSVVETAEGRQVRDVLDKLVVGLANEIGKVIERPEIVETDPKYFTDAVDALLKIRKNDQSSPNSVGETFGTKLASLVSNTTVPTNAPSNTSESKPKFLELEAKIDALTKTVEGLSPIFKEEKDELMKLIEQLKDELEKKKSDTRTEQETGTGVIQIESEPERVEQGTDSANFLEQSQPSGLEKKLTEKDAEIERLQKELEDALQEAKNQLDILTNKNAEQSKLNATAAAELQATIDKLNLEKETLSNENESKIEKISAELVLKKNDLIEANEEKSKLQAELNAKKQELLAASDEEKKGVEQQILEFKTNLEAATNKALEQETELNETKAKLDKVNQAKDAAIAEKQAEIEQKQAEIARINTEKEIAIKEANTVNKQQESKIQDLKIKLIKAQTNSGKEVEELKSEIIKTNEALGKLQEEQAQSQLEKNELEKQLEAKQAEVAVKEQQVRDLTTKLNNSGSKNEALESQIEQATTDLANAKEDLKKTLSDLNKKIQKIQENDEEITKLNEEITKLNEEKNNLEQNHSELQAANTRLTKELDDMKAKLQKAEQENASLKPYQVTQLDGTPDYSKIMNGILASIHGGGREENGQNTIHEVTSDFLVDLNTADINIKIDNCKTDNQNKDDVKLRELLNNMKNFKDLINKVIYGTPVLLMLNSLSFDEYQKLKTTVDKINEPDNNNISIQSLSNYMSKFTNFIFIDTTQIYEFNEQQQDSYTITNSEKPSDFLYVNAKLDNVYTSLNKICKEIVEGISKPTIDVMDTRKENLQNVFATPSNDNGLFDYKEKLKITHILELISYFDKLINLDINLFTNKFNNNDLYAFLNSFMYGRITKLNQLIGSVKEIETCTDDCKDDSVSCQKKPCNISLNSFKQTLSELTYERKPVSTYLILNNRGDVDQSGGNIYNKNRFGLNTDKGFRYLQLKYNDDDKKASNNPQLAPEQNGGKYGKTYLFGELDKIYPLTLPDKGIARNEFIASDLLKIQSQLLAGKLVFLFGYGQSGAGKTSTLIYFKNPLKKESGEQGVLVYLCNLFGKGTYKTNSDNKAKIKYTNLKLITQEFYGSSNVAVGKCDNTINNGKCAEQTFYFKFLGGQFTLSGDNTKKTKFDYRHETTDSNNQFSDTSFGGVLQYLIDKDRFVKPTTNNPDSSRSHSLIYIVLSDKNGNKLRIGLADLAGVESKFKCDEQDVIKAFLELNKDRESKDNSSYINNDIKRTYGISIDPQFNLFRKDVDELLKKVFTYNVDGSFGNTGDEQVAELFKKFDEGLTNFFQGKGAVPEELENVTIEENQLNYVNNIIIQTAYNAISNAFKEKIGGNRKTRKHVRKTKDKTRKNLQSGGDGAKSVDNFKNQLKSINVNDIKTLKQLMHESDKNVISNKGGGVWSALSTWIMDNVNNVDIFTECVELLNKTHTSNYNVDTWNDYEKFVTDIIAKNTIDELVNLLNENTATKNQKIMIARKIQKLIEKIPNKYEYAKQIMKYGKDICLERTSEGDFINKTLTELRENIFEIMIKKTKQWIYYSPSFHYECLSDLCPTGRNCFSINSTTKESTEPKSLIIKWLFDKYKTDENPDALYDDFCSNIQIGLFGVFNIWKGANDPPPVSYIDINELKKMWNKMNDTNYSGDGINLLNADTKEINKIIQDVSTYIANRKVEQSIKDLVTTISNLGEKTFSYNGNTLTGPYRDLIDEFIKSIEINNSTTAIGTLEYLDSFAKLNTTNTICSKPATETFTNITEEIK